MRGGKGIRVNDDVMGMNKKECGGRNDKCTICGLLVRVFDRLVLSSVEKRASFARYLDTHTYIYTYIYHICIFPII